MRKSSEQNLQRWLRRLRGSDKLLRVHAAMCLTAPGEDITPALPDLEAALHDADPEVRRLASWVLARVRSERAAA